MDYLRESYIKDIVDIIADAKKAYDDNGKKIFGMFSGKNNDYHSSISKRSKDLIMTFPVICSNTLEPRTATMVSKAIERKCVTMLHLLFASQSLTNIDNASDAIKKFHNNINMDTLSVDDYVDLANQIDTITNENAIINEGIKNVMSDLKEALRETSFNDSINESSLQDYYVNNRYGNITVVKEARGDYSDIASASKNTTEEFSKRLMDNDVKKCNELVPSLLVIKFTCASDVAGVNMETAVVGVKARMIAVDSFEIIDKIFVKSNDKNGLLKLIRATTREISFFKDFLFAIDKAKIDALSNSRRGSTNRIWKTLETRATKSRFRKAMRSSNDASAITSLVITQEEVNYLKKQYNINMESVSQAKVMLEAYNLLSVVIVDESIEACKFLFDGDDSYEVLSFNNLERESGDGMYKKVITLMSKMNR